MKNIKEELNIEEFDFSSRVLWVLARNNINKERLTAMSYDELKAIPTMGAEKISEIKRELELKGFNNIVVQNYPRSQRMLDNSIKTYCLMKL